MPGVRHGVQEIRHEKTCNGHSTAGHPCWQQFFHAGSGYGWCRDMGDHPARGQAQRKPAVQEVIIHRDSSSSSTVVPHLYLKCSNSLYH